MKLILPILLLLFLTIKLSAQNKCPECEKFQIVGIYDLPANPQAPGGNFFVLLLTVTEDLNPGFDPFYTDLYFVSNLNDTVSIPPGATQTLPTHAVDTFPFILELNTEESNQDFPDNFNGKLVIITPTAPPCPNETRCQLSYSSIMTTTHNFNKTELFSSLYPNPTTNRLTIHTNGRIKEIAIYSLTGKHLKSLFNYSNGQKISLENLPGSTFVFRVLFKNGFQKTHFIIKH